MKIWCFFQDFGGQLVHIDHRAEIRSHDKGRLLLCQISRKGGLGVLMEYRAGGKCCHWQSDSNAAGKRTKVWKEVKTHQNN